MFVIVFASICEAKKGFHKAMPESEPFDRISTDYVSPHIKWARPFVSGKLKVLVLASLMRHRETIELSQRLDMEFDTMISSGPNEFIGEYFFLTREETLKLNMSKLAPDREYDVIIIAVSWFILPKEMKLEIARRVKAGTGALFTDSNGYKAFMESAPKILEAEEFRGVKIEPEELAHGEDEEDEEDEELEFDEKEEQAPPAQSAGKFVRLSMTPEAMQTNIRVSETTFGQGRVVSIYGVGQARLHSSTPALMPKVGMEGKRRKRVLYEFHTAHLAKAVVYTAQKEPKSTIRRMRLEFGKQPLSGTPRGLTVELKSEVAMPRARIDLMVFDELRNERMRRQKDIALRPGENTIALDMPFLPEGGRHFVAARLMQGDKVVSWDAISVKPSAANSVRSFEFQPFYRRGERITGKVSLRGPLTKRQSITIEILDNLNRVLHRQSTEQGKVFAIDVPAFTALVPMHHVRAIIREADVRIFDYDHSFLVQMPPVDNYNYVLWTDTSHYYYRQLLMDRYYELGVTAATPSITLASSNLRPWPYITRLAQWRESIEERERRIQQEVDEAARNSTSQFKTGALDPKTKKIDAALDLEGIKTSNDKVKSIGPVSKPCFNDPKWVEQITKKLQEAVRDSEPFSPVGYSLGDENMINLTCHSEHCIREFRKWLKDQFKDIGTLNNRYGSQFKDWDGVMWPTFADAKMDSGKLVLWYDRQRFTDWTFNNAHLICRRAVHSVAPDAPIGFSSFYPPQPERGLDALRMFPWATFNNQYQDLRWEDLMRAFSPRDAHLAVIQGTYSGYKHRLEFVCYPWLEFFRGANGKMWWRGQYFKDATSCLDPGYTPLPPFHNTIKMANEVRRGLFHLFRNYEFQNYGIRVLYSMADMYAAYVKDQKDGPRNWLRATQSMYKNMRHHGWQFDYVSARQLEEGALSGAKLLFLPRTECMSPAMAEAIRSFVENGGTLVADAEPGTRAMNLRPNGRALLNELFAGLKEGEVRPVGKGHVFLSGSLLQRGKWKETTTSDLVKSLVEKSKVNKGWSLQHSDGRLATGWELFTYKSGSATLLAIGARDSMFDAEPETYTLQLSVSSVVYDIRDRKKLGTGKRFELSLNPARPKILAALPVPMGTLVAELSATTNRAGDPLILKIQIQPAPDFMTTCYVELVVPNGRRLRHYARTVVLKNGQAEHVIPTALNDTGLHRVVVTETISGQQKELPIDLKYQE